MPAPAYTQLDFTAALQALKPRGRVWPRDLSSMQGAVAHGLAKIYEQNSDRAQYLLSDAFPAAATELLPEWEATFGLPDDCIGSLDTLQERRNAVVAMLVGGGGQSIPYFTALAASLGYTITVSGFFPHRVTSTVDQPICGIEWAHAWQVTTAGDTRVWADVTSPVNEPLSSWQFSLLECMLSRFRPAHSVILFAYT